MADHHHRLIDGKFGDATLQFRQGNQQAVRHPTVGAAIFLSRTHIQQGEAITVGRHPGGGKFGQARIAALQWRPTWVCSRAGDALIHGLARAHVARQGFGDPVGVGQLHGLHVTNEIPFGGHTAQAGVEGFFFNHRADRAALVVVPWIEQAGVGQAEELLGNRGPEGMGVALLKVTATAAPHQQGVTTECHRLIVEHKTEAAIGMTWGAAHLEPANTKGQPIPVLQGHGHVFRPSGCSQANCTASGLVQQPAAGDVVGVGMGIEGGHQLEPQLTE